MAKTEMTTLLGDVCQCSRPSTFLLRPDLSLSLSWWEAYHVHALKAETTGFMVASGAALSDVGERFARSSGRGGLVLGELQAGYRYGRDVAEEK